MYELFAKDSEESRYLKNSEWTNCDEAVSSSENTIYGKFYGNYDSYRFRNEEGNDAIGWQLVNGSWYYFNPDNGNRAIQSAWALINGRWYFFNEYCVMQTGWIKLMVSGIIWIQAELWLQDGFVQAIWSMVLLGYGFWSNVA